MVFILIILFLALSSLDAGYFGKGIYFTSFPFYTLPYISSRRIPAIILSWVLPGKAPLPFDQTVFRFSKKPPKHQTQKPKNCKPVSVVSNLVGLGHVYPVIEDHQGQDSLIGAAIKPGYNAHFIVTDKSGVCLQKEVRVTNPYELEVLTFFLAKAHV